MHLFPDAQNARLWGVRDANEAVRHAWVDAHDLDHSCLDGWCTCEDLQHLVAGVSTCADEPAQW